MKKILLILVAVAVLATVSAIWVLSKTGITNAAVLVPADTVVLASLTDLPRTAYRWPKSSLAKIGAEPEMKAFLEKPLAHLMKQKGGDEAASILMALKPGRIFFAAREVTPAGASGLIGVQYWGGAGQFDSAVNRLRSELAEGTAPAATVEDYQGTPISGTTHGEGLSIYSASHGNWGFISNSPAVIRDALDRAAGRLDSGALVDDPRYQTVLKRLPADSDALVFVDPRAILDTLLAVGETMQARPDPQQVDQLRKAEAIGAAFKIDGPNMRDAVFILRQNPPDIGNLNHAAIQFAPPETTAYFDFIVNLGGVDAILSAAGLAPLISAQSGGPGIGATISEAFGPEVSISALWPMDQMRPRALLTLPIKDVVKAEQLLTLAASNLPQTNVSDVAGLRVYTFPSLQSTFVNPAVALTPEFLLAGLDASDIEFAVTRPADSANLESSPAFATALPVYKSANEVFGYLDPKAIFERSFPLLRQVIVFGAAFMPGASDIIDTTKLPQTDTIARHLSPIVYSQTRLSDGYFIESSGPITMNQAALLSAGAGSSLIGPRLMGQ